MTFTLGGGPVLQRKKLVRQFMSETGYTNSTTELHGIRKDHLRNNEWVFKDPEQMLWDFHKWLCEKESGK